MINLFNVALIGSVLLGVAHGASVATAGSRYFRCTVEDGFQAAKCLSRLINIQEKVQEHDMANQSNMKNFVSACNSLHTCFSNIRCDKNKEYMLKSVENYCEFVAYVHVDFAECNEKLNDNGSKCFKNWEPMSIGIPDMNDEICEKIFKRKDCMKKDIVKTCGKKEWRSFREKVINPFAKKCDFRRY
ncbi:T20D4.11-like domain-containing protein [Caenorhabditis elegans]|uniref:T20D4.11-like domain-containing protein n=1 Tax=Caenorhabditis elegans TaxID=6239 RepID=Q965Z4_CAEEL|nr:DUF19 domain-containing protein [Caenorhabditis elegans]CCD64281.1 DUF19 domain-containing protein [Caenorhabditis elegans]|eukprot:NP_504997.1 Uncharacterized protein CELE_ZK105.1 [Caenorhabditis elegans]